MVHSKVSKAMANIIVKHAGKESGIQMLKELENVSGVNGTFKKVIQEVNSTLYNFKNGETKVHVS